MVKDTTKNQMWGGRFRSQPAEIMQEINNSISFDYKLFRQDIQGSLAHAAMLAQQKILSQQDYEDICRGLKTILEEIETGTFDFSPALEDIHMNIEARLAKIIGPGAGRLHTARSRNDQVATDLRLWVKQEIKETLFLLYHLLEILLSRAEEYADTIMPGFTHLQSAQPVTFGHHLMAYVEMFGRDFLRMEAARSHMDECPLGAAALAGTSFPINRFFTAKALGFGAPTRNSLDSVSDRDFVLEYMSAASICSMHLSRLAEEIVLWCSAQFRFLVLSDAFATGSSIMPQKKNPDAAELIRAKTGRLYGNLLSLLTVMKGLPLAYSKDMQEDKEAVFDSAKNLRLCLSAMIGMVEDLQAEKKNMQESAASGYATATDLADWLVQKLNLPFRQAHHITGEAVALALAKNLPLEALSLEDLKKLHPDIHEEIFDVLSVEKSIHSRTSYGGTAPSQVRQQIAYWKERLKTLKETLSKERNP